MEYLILVIEFFIVKGWKAIIWYFLIPLILGLLIFYGTDDNAFYLNSTNYYSNIITVLGILMGFTISTFTILLTVNNPNTDKAKNTNIGKVIFNKQISLFDTVLIGSAYIILVQGLLLILNFIYPLFIPTMSLHVKALFAINISLVIHVIVVLMRNILDFYFIITK